MGSLNVTLNMNCIFFQHWMKLALLISLPYKFRSNGKLTERNEVKYVTEKYLVEEIENPPLSSAGNIKNEENINDDEKGKQREKNVPKKGERHLGDTTVIKISKSKLKKGIEELKNKSNNTSEEAEVLDYSVMSPMSSFMSLFYTNETTQAPLPTPYSEKPTPYSEKPTTNSEKPTPYSETPVDIQSENKMSESYVYDDDGFQRQLLLQQQMNNCTCGKHRDTGSRIVGGRTAKHENYPWQAKIVDLTTGNNICGGTVITRKHILSAAHCYVSDSDFYFVDHTEKLAVVLKDSGERKKVEEVRLKFTRSTWEQNPDILGLEDIAILCLKVSLTFSFQLFPVCLPKYENTKTDKNFLGKAKILGWGQTKQKKYDVNDYFQKRRVKRQTGQGPQKPDNGNYLKEASINIISDEECTKMLNAIWHEHGWPGLGENQFCAHKPGNDACQGDSGGPIIQVHDRRLVQLGVISTGPGCGDPRFPGIYMKVQRYLEWIVLHTDGEDLLSSDCTKLNAKAW